MYFSSIILYSPRRYKYVKYTTHDQAMGGARLTIWIKNIGGSIV